MIALMVKAYPPMVSGRVKDLSIGEPKTGNGQSVKRSW